MSEIVENGPGLALVAREPAGGMITLRGDHADARLAGALDEVLGAPVPGLRRWTGGGGGQALWMSPDELLLLVPEAAGTLARLGPALAGGFFTLADVSDARARFSVTGRAARDVLAKLAPVDFFDFPVGSVRRTRTAQAAAAIWREEGERFGLVCFRSVADYVEELLRNAAAPGGEVGLYR